MSISSPSPPCLDVDQTTPAILEWKCDDATHYLAEPDPKIDDISLRIRFVTETSSALFELRFPLNLKGVDGCSDIFIPIQPPSIISLDFSFAATPYATQVKLKGSTLVRLDFQLNRSLDILVPSAAKEPLTPSRAQSGKVIDALRLLSNATSFSVYIQAKKLPKAKLQPITSAIAQGHLKPLRQQDDLTSMYHGKGAKVADLSVRVDHPPPSYNEIEPPPPMALINEKKRRRTETEDATTNQIALLWAELIPMREQNQQLQQRVAVLEKENRDLKREVEQLQADDYKTADALEALDNRVIELQDDQEDLEEKFDFIREQGVDSDAEERFVERVKNRVLDEISTRLSRN
ncbi:Fc.00g052580.m01.CDS01 [Cosmosporella sp. VM-42]